MKSLKTIIQEKLIINKNIKSPITLLSDKCDKMIYSKKELMEYYPKAFNKEIVDEITKYIIDYPLYIWILDTKTPNTKLGDYQKEFHDRYNIELLKETGKAVNTEYASASIMRTNKNNYYEFLVMPIWSKLEDGDELKTKLFFIFPKYNLNK